MSKLLGGMVILFFVILFGLLWWAICELMGTFDEEIFVNYEYSLEEDF